jgi:aminopeptidase I
MPTKNNSAKMRQLSPGDYEQPFVRFMTDNPTVFHAINAFEEELQAAGFKLVSHDLESSK